MERNEATSMTEADWLHLKPYGYAPGSYTKKCLFCDSIMRDVDKAATKCRYCAEQKYAEASAAPPAAPQTEAERLAQALIDCCSDWDGRVMGGDEQPMPSVTCGKLLAAAAELRRLSADARRYAWLRLRGAKFPEPIGCMSELLLDEELDAAIDQAMDGK